MLLSAERSLLLIVDVQERLAPAMHELDGVVANLRVLLSAATELDIPVLVSEQYPHGLGRTIPEITALLPSHATLFEKTHFSCMAEPGFAGRLAGMARDQIVVAGIESHICVLQTALGLVTGGRSCFVVGDACTSRAPASYELAMARMRSNGCEVVSTEMVLFEWLHRAATPAFKALSPLIR